MTEANRGEGRFNRVARSEMAPVLGREVVERQQHFSVLLQALTSLRVLGFVLLHEFIECLLCVGLRRRLPDFVEVALGFRLNTPGHVVENVRRLVNPAALLACLGEYLAKRRPESQCTVANSNLRSRCQASLL